MALARRDKDRQGGTFVREGGPKLNLTGSSRVVPISKKVARAPMGKISSSYAMKYEDLENNLKNRWGYLYGPKLFKIVTLGLLPAAQEADKTRDAQLLNKHAVKIIPEVVHKSKFVYSTGEHPKNYTGIEVRNKLFFTRDGPIMAGLAAAGLAGLLYAPGIYGSVTGGESPASTVNPGTAPSTPATTPTPSPSAKKHHKPKHPVQFQTQSPAAYFDGTAVVEQAPVFDVPADAPYDHSAITSFVLAAETDLVTATLPAEA